MGLGKFFKSLFGKEEDHKAYKSPEVTFLGDNASGVTHTIPISVAPLPQQIIIKNDDDYLVFDSKEDIPPELLVELEHLDDLGTVDSYSVIIDGERQIYTSYEDIPEEVRSAMKDMIKE